MKSKLITRRRFLQLSAFATASAATLAACAPAAQPGAPAAPSDTQAADVPTTAPSTAAGLTGQIEYMHYDLGPANQSREEAVRAFEQANPGAKVKLSVLPYDEMYQKVAATMAAGQPPDVIYGDFSLLRYALEKQLLDFSDYFKADPVLSKPDLFITDMTDAVQAKYGTSRMHALIMGTWVPILYYNKDIFDAAGEPYPTDDWTWDDAREAAKRLTKPEQGQYGLQFGTTFDNVGWLWWLQKPDDFWAVPQVFPAKTAFDSPVGLNVMRLYYETSVVDKSQITPDENATYQVYAGGFGAGKVAMFSGGDWDAGWSFRDLQFNYGMALIPKMRADYRPALNTMLSTNAIAAATKNPDLAWAFARFLTADKEGATIIGRGAYETPVLKEVAMSDAVLKPEWAPQGYDARVRAAALPGPMYTPYPLNLNLWEFPSKFLDPTIEKLRKGEMKPEEAVAYLDSEGIPYFAAQREEMKKFGIE
ncbi:MAG: extracellular solute-binding protein [Anaerolineae bacterium]|nr:extracellular solute-binding protein [Candidatus Roseilinea sp.]MDW8448400.1 extracellular solute-binding protein [Anaerolineae bacterium]